jgi:peptide/nickel transport system permease protein
MSIVQDALVVEGPDAEAPLAPAAAKTRAKLRRGSWRLVTGGSMVGLIIAFAVVFPFTGSYEPYAQDLNNVLQKPGLNAHFLGTDMLGRDIASRLALATRVTLGITAAIVVLNAIIGTAIGIMAGYLGGPADNALMGLADIQLAMPVMLVLVALSAALGPSVNLMIVVLSVTFWVGYARVSRSSTLSLRGREFVLMPKMQGASAFWILRRHILPHVAPQMLIIAATDVAVIVMATAAFDFLGLGVQPPTPSLGLMISEGQVYIRQDAWLVLVPGLVVFLFVAGINLISQQFTAEGRAPQRHRPAKGRP